MNLGKNWKYSGVLEVYTGRWGLVTKPGEGQEWCWASRTMGTSASWVLLGLFCLFFFFKKWEEREHQVLLFHLFMYSLVDSCMCLHAWLGIEPITLAYRPNALTNWATQLSFWLNSFSSLTGQGTNGSWITFCTFCPTKGLSVSGSVIKIPWKDFDWVDFGHSRPPPGTEQW